MVFGIVIGAIIGVLLAVPYVVYLERANAKLSSACREALTWLENAPLDYSNGVTDPTGTMDEGNVRGWQGHEQIVNSLKRALEE